MNTASIWQQSMGILKCWIGSNHNAIGNRQQDQNKKSHFVFSYISDAIDAAVCNGHVNVLEGFRSECIIHLATVFGRIHVLAWCKNAGFIFGDIATHNGHIDILEWFKNSKYKMGYAHTVCLLLIYQKIIIC